MPMKVRGWIAFAVLASWVAVLGCDDGVDSSINPDPCVPSLCDIRAAECQRDVALAVHCFRGGQLVMPEVEVIDPAELDARFRDDEPTEQEQLQYERLMRGLALFGLANANASLDDLRAEVTAEIAAIYDHERGHILIVDRGSAMNDKQAIATLAHEMVHAMQDDDHDLSALTGSAQSTDELLAIKALVEGEAVHYEVVTYAALEGAGPERINWGSFYPRFQGDQVEAALTDASPIAMSTIRFPYAFGGDFVTKLILYEGQIAVHQRFRAPPKSTRRSCEAARPRRLSSTA
jgi:hypothetical protein